MSIIQNIGGLISSTVSGPSGATKRKFRLILPSEHGSKVRIKTNWLARIIVGKSMTEANERQIRDWARERKPSLTVVKAHFDPLKLELACFSVGATA
jgi:hypothetical protein